MEYSAGVEVPPLSLSAVFKAPSSDGGMTSSLTSPTTQPSSGSQSARFQISGRFKTLRRRSESNGGNGNGNGSDQKGNEGNIVVSANTGSGKVTSSGVIGCPLKELKKEGRVPAVASYFVDSLFRLGVEEANGIFKKNGKFVEVEKLKKNINSGVFTMPSDVHVCASVFKLWIRSLPEPLIPNSLYEDALKCDIDEEAMKVFERIEDESTKDLIAFVIHFLAHLSQDDIRSKTLMNDANLASVFAPCFMKCPYTDVNQMLAAQERQSNCILAFIDAAKSKMLPDPGFEKVLENSKIPIQETSSVPSSAPSTPSDAAVDIPPPATPPPPPLPPEVDGGTKHRRRSSTRGMLSGHAKSASESGQRKASVSSASGTDIPPPLPASLESGRRKTSVSSASGVDIPPPLPASLESGRRKASVSSASGIDIPPPLPMSTESGQRKASVSSASGVDIPPPLPNELRVF